MQPLPHHSGRRILVTGASGFIGSHLCHRLCRDGNEVHAVSRNAHSAGADPLHWWQGDVEDVTTVRGIFRAASPEIVFHLASHVVGARELEAVLPTFRSNLASTVNLLTAATEMGCRRIVLAGSLEEPEPGNSEPAPCSPYAAAKWASSVYGRMFYDLYQTPVVIARVFMTYGPGQQDFRKLIPYVTMSLLRGQTPKLSSGRRPVDWIYVDDVVAGLLAAAHVRDVEGCTVDLGSGTLVPIRAVVTSLVALIDPRVEPEFGALPDRTRERARRADADHAYAKLGWKAETALKQGLARTVEWYRKQLNGLSPVNARSDRSDSAPDKRRVSS